MDIVLLWTPMVVVVDLRQNNCLYKGATKWPQGTVGPRGSLPRLPEAFEAKMLDVAWRVAFGILKKRGAGLGGRFQRLGSKAAVHGLHVPEAPSPGSRLTQARLRCRSRAKALGRV